ncbi:MAG: DUF4097 family beta strand repeat protein [Mollicutes bacterium]|nr:DUF4097 family beta strand repeat protein [Mollicutes bacterium]
MFKILSRVISLVIFVFIIFIGYKIFIKKEEIKPLSIINKTNKSKMQSFEIDKDILEIDIELENTELMILEGEKIKIETNNQNINIKQKDNKLSVEEKHSNALKLIKGNVLKLTVPKDYVFKEVEIEAGAGKVKIDYLLTEDLELDLGAGKVDIKNIVTYDNTQIDGGAGSLKIDNCTFKDLELKLGLGTLFFTGNLEGDSSIECGVGSSNIKLYGTKNDYELDIDIGLGDFKVENQVIKKSTIIGNGKRKIDINGSLGSINIEFLD